MYVLQIITFSTQSHRLYMVYRLSRLPLSLIDCMCFTDHHDWHFISHPICFLQIITVGTLSQSLYVYYNHHGWHFVSQIIYIYFLQITSFSVVDIYSARLTCVRTNRRSMCDMINITSASLFIRIFSGTQFIQLLESTEVMKRSHGHNSSAQLWVAHFKDSRMEEVYRYSSQTSTSA